MQEPECALARSEQADQCRRAQLSRRKVPTTLVWMNGSGESIERSTCDRRRNSQSRRSDAFKQVFD